MKVKLEDVAKEAGVSIATVSRVLNRHPVSEKARTRVEEAIARLDYQPNLLARGLSKGCSSRIGVIVSNMENPYYASIMNSMESRLRDEFYLCNFASSSLRGEEESDIIRRFLASGVDGLVIVDVGTKDENSGLYARLNNQLPVVLINGNPERTDTNLIMVDQEHGMRLALDYLEELGHRNIAYLRGKAPAFSFDCKERVFHNRLSSYGEKDPKQWVLRLDDTDHFESVELSCKLFERFLDEHEAPTAVFTANEVMALGVLRAAKRRGLSIPGDISLIAQDNTIFSRISDPPLTTIDMNTQRLGREAAEMMLNLLSSRDRAPRRMIFYPELIVRESCRAIKTCSTGEK